MILVKVIIFMMIIQTYITFKDMYNSILFRIIIFIKTMETQIELYFPDKNTCMFWKNKICEHCATKKTTKKKTKTKP